MNRPARHIRCQRPSLPGPHCTCHQTTPVRWGQLTDGAFPLLQNRLACLVGVEHVAGLTQPQHRVGVLGRESRQTCDLVLACLRSVMSRIKTTSRVTLRSASKMGCTWYMTYLPDCSSTKRAEWPVWMAFSTCAICPAATSVGRKSARLEPVSFSSAVPHCRAAISLAARILPLSVYQQRRLE